MKIDQVLLLVCVMSFTSLGLAREAPERVKTPQFLKSAVASAQERRELPMEARTGLKNPVMIPVSARSQCLKRNKKAGMPYIYIPLIVVDEDYQTYLGLTNPTDSPTNYTLQSICPNGGTISEESGTLGAHCRLYQLLDGTSEEIYWIRIQYDNALDGYVNFVSSDLQKSAFVKASSTLESMLFVPHIASKTDYWNSYSAIVNATDQTASFMFDYLNGTIDMPSPSASYEQYYFEWHDDLLYSVFNDTNYWGIVKPIEAAKLSYDGEWVGTNSQDRVFNFTVSDNRVTGVDTDVYFSNCGLSQRTTLEFSPGYSINGNSFAFSTSGSPVKMVISGTFITSASATGTVASTYSNPYPYCRETVNLTWQATKEGGGGNDPMLAGMEMFGRKGDVHQVGAFDLRNNQAEILYFAHIAANRVYWWTGVAIEDVSPNPITVDFVPYDANGTELTGVTYDMASNEKLVKVVDNFWTDKGLEYPAETAWIKVIAQGGEIIGFELFGTHGEDARLLTGINAATEGAEGLLFAHVEVGENGWTGITFVNISELTATIRLEAYDNDGNNVGDSPAFELAPYGKVVDLAQNFFDGDVLPTGATYVIAVSDQPILGFELWGNLIPRQDYISGMLASPISVPAEGESYTYSFEYLTTGVLCWDDGWELAVFSDNTDEYAEWFHAGEDIFSKVQSWTDIYPQQVPDGVDYMVGFYGESGVRVHQALVSPSITLSADASTVSFYSQFGYPGDATASDFFYISEDLELTSFFDSAALLNEFTTAYIHSLPASSEISEFTQWKQESFDISAYAGKTVRFMFELDSSYGESWHIDMFEILTSASKKAK